MSWGTPGVLINLPEEWMLWVWLGLIKRQKQKKKKQLDEARGLSAFDPAQLTAVLESSLFHVYIAMITIVEQVPTQLAEAAEECPCHSKLLKAFSMHKRRNILTKHFKSERHICPMAGKLMPELVTGMLQDALEAVWLTGLQDLLNLPGSPVLAPVDWEIVLGDFEKGTCAVSVILRLKTDYIRKLPWLLHGLACTDMPRARQVAAQALETWEQDPRPEAHHRVTVLFMCNPGLVSDLRRFSDGCSLEECSVDFQLEVAKRRFFLMCGNNHRREARPCLQIAERI